MDSILIVDDDPHVCSLLAAVLEKAGYFCQTAENEAHARQALAEKPFDLLLTDLDMPEESGIYLIRHTKQRYSETAERAGGAHRFDHWLKICLQMGIQER